MTQLLKHTAAALLGLALLSAPVAVVAAPASTTGPTTLNGITTQTASAADAFPGYRKFLNMPLAQRDQVNLYYALRIKHADPSKVRVSLIYKGVTTPIQIQASGRLSPLPTREQLNGDAQVSISGPEGAGVAMKIHPYSTQPNGRVYDAVGLSTGIRQGNVAMTKIAGPLAMMVPQLDRVYFIGGGQGTVDLDNGQSVPLPRTTTAGEYPAGTPYFVPSQMSGAIKIHLSAPASLAHFDTPPK